MPVEVFWEIRDLIQKADYLIAAGNEQVGITEIYKKIFKKVAPYVLSEAERVWMYGKIT